MDTHTHTHSHTHSLSVFLFLFLSLSLSHTHHLYRELTARIRLFRLLISPTKMDFYCFGLFQLQSENFSLLVFFACVFRVCMYGGENVFCAMCRVPTLAGALPTLRGDRERERNPRPTTPRASIYKPANSTQDAAHPVNGLAPGYHNSCNTRVSANWLGANQFVPTIASN